MTEVKGWDESEFKSYRRYELESWFSNIAAPLKPEQKVKFQTQKKQNGNRIKGNDITNL